MVADASSLGEKAIFVRQDLFPFSTAYCHHAQKNRRAVQKPGHLEVLRVREGPWFQICPGRAGPEKCP